METVSVAISASLFMMPTPALADPFDKGARAFQRGEYPEAVRWYATSADAGYIPAIPAIAVLYYNNGQREQAFELFSYGALWNDLQAGIFCKLTANQFLNPTFGMHASKNCMLSRQSVSNRKTSQPIYWDRFLRDIIHQQ